MTLSELRYIVAVAHERSFGRAAQRCFVSQPALSVAIQKLEEELGTRLFERGKAEVSVTPVGERIVEQAQKVLEEAARVKELAQAGKNELSGPLRLGAIYTIAPYLLPDLSKLELKPIQAQVLPPLFFRAELTADLYTQPVGPGYPHWHWIICVVRNTGLLNSGVHGKRRPASDCGDIQELPAASEGSSQRTEKAHVV